MGEIVWINLPPAMADDDDAVLRALLTVNVEAGGYDVVADAPIRKRVYTSVLDPQVRMLQAGIETVDP